MDVSPCRNDALQRAEHAGFGKLYGRSQVSQEGMVDSVDIRLAQQLDRKAWPYATAMARTIQPVRRQKPQDPPAERQFMASILAITVARCYRLAVKSLPKEEEQGWICVAIPWKSWGSAIIGSSLTAGRCWAMWNGSRVSSGSPRHAMDDSSATTVVYWRRAALSPAIVAESSRYRTMSLGTD